MRTMTEDRQPVHVLYGGAQRFKPDTVVKLGAIARDALQTYVPDAQALAAITGMDPGIAVSVYPRIITKLQREPIEDYRIDFEDGYGYHTNAEEDVDAITAADHFRHAVRPPFCGIRIKPLAPASAERARRTLELFLGRAGKLPPGFVVTLPKVTSKSEVAELHDLLRDFDETPNRIRIELMIETPQVIVDARGVCLIPALIDAAKGRCRSLHFGPYDYTSSLGMISSQQSLSHPACDFARHMMQVAAAGTGVFLSDGPTKTIPLPPDRAPSVPAQQALRIHYDDVRRSLRHGFYQGWDLHPAQLPTRYAALYAFFLEGLDTAAGRLRNFIEAFAQATLHGSTFDDAASGQGLVNFFLRGLACGALIESDLEATGLTAAELRTRSFARIVENRRTK